MLYSRDLKSLNGSVGMKMFRENFTKFVLLLD